MILENIFQLHKVVASYKCISIHPLVSSNYSLYIFTCHDDCTLFS